MKNVSLFLGIVFLSIFVVGANVSYGQFECPGDGEVINGSLNSATDPLQTSRII